MINAIIYHESLNFPQLVEPWLNHPPWQGAEKIRGAHLRSSTDPADDGPGPGSGWPGIWGSTHALLESLMVVKGGEWLRVHGQ